MVNMEPSRYGFPQGLNEVKKVFQQGGKLTIEVRKEGDGYDVRIKKKHKKDREASIDDQIQFIKGFAFANKENNKMLGKIKKKVLLWSGDRSKFKRWGESLRRLFSKKKKKDLQTNREIKLENYLNVLPRDGGHTLGKSQDEKGLHDWLARMEVAGTGRQKREEEGNRKLLDFFNFFNRNE